MASVIDFNVHMRRDINGNRYIERITECQRIENSSHSRGYGDVVIMEYCNGMYIPVHPISERTQLDMIRDMTLEDAEQFKQFIDSYWRGYVVA
ncbi:hypothetical protein D3C78_1678850 [compost metagenome]